MSFAWRSFLVLALTLSACKGDDDPDSGTDAGTDASRDDASFDAGTDTGTDAGEEDTGTDAPADVGMDVGPDAGTDVGFDSGPPDIVDDCDDLCRLTPMTDGDEAACTVDAADALGYDLDTSECAALAEAFFTGTATRQQCNRCYGSVSMTDEDCRSIYFSCY